MHVHKHRKRITKEERAQQKQSCGCILILQFLSCISDFILQPSLHVQLTLSYFLTAFLRDTEKFKQNRAGVCLCLCVCVKQTR